MRQDLVNPYKYKSPSSPTVANTDAFILSKNQQSFSSQLAAELSWVLVLAGLVWYGPTCVMRMCRQLQKLKWNLSSVPFLHVLCFIYYIYIIYHICHRIASVMIRLLKLQPHKLAAEMWSEPVLTNSHYSTSSLQRLDLNIAPSARVSCSVTRDGCTAALPYCNPRTLEKSLLCCMSQCQFINVKFVQSLLMVIIRSNQSK